MTTTPAPLPTSAPRAPDAKDTTSAIPHGYLAGVSVASFGVYFAILTPVLVSMAFKIQHIAPGKEVSALGLVMGVGAAFALVANPLFGRLSDRTMSRYGRRRPWIVGGTLVGTLALALIGTAQNVATVLLAWCVAQVALNATLSAVTATLPDQVPVERRGKVSGVLGLTTPLAILAGSVVVNALTTDLARFLVPALIGLVLVLGFAVVLKDTVRTEHPTEPFGLRQLLGSFAFNPRKHPDFGWTWITKFLVMFGYAGIATYLPFYLTDTFDLSEKDATATILAANVASVAAMMLSAPLCGVLSDRIGKRRPFVATAGCIMALGLVVLAFAPSIAVVIAAQAIIGFGAGGFMSVDQALASQVLPDPDDTAKDLGVLNMANALPQSLAPAMAPALIAVGTAVGIGGYSFWYLFGALVSVVGGVLVYRIKGVK